MVVWYIYNMPKNSNDLEANLKELESGFDNLNIETMADRAVYTATRQIMACTEFKKPRLAKLARYWELYDGRVPKKLRQLFNVPIPVFPGMVDTLNAQYDTPINLEFREADAADYFKVQKINGAFQMEVMSSAENSKWDSKLRMARRHAIINGVGILKYTAESDPEYKSTLDVVNLKDFIFQPRGGNNLEKHLFAGEENIDRTQSQLLAGAKSGIYDEEQVKLLIQRGNDRNYYPSEQDTINDRLSRFSPLNLDPDNNSFVGQTVYKMAQMIIEIKGERYLLFFHPWTKTWLRFEKWKEIDSSNLYPWKTFHTHEDDENFLSKSYGDDMYAAADAIVAMFNQELTNREKRNFGARAYDKDMFKDVRKLDEAMHRPDALVPADTKQGNKRISEGIYEFKVGDLGGTVNLIDWITGTLGRNTGATDMAQGSVQEVSKKASIAFAEQKSISKRLSWASQPFQEMMAQLGKSYVYGLKDHMPSEMAIRLLGSSGWDWDTITRMDLSTTKNPDVIIMSTDKQEMENDLKKEKRKEALTMVLNSTNINTQKRDEEILMSIGDYKEQEVAEFLDVKTYADKRSIARAEEAIQMVGRGQTPRIWFVATASFMQKIVDFANDNYFVDRNDSEAKQRKNKEKYDILINYASKHKEFAMQNMERKTREDLRVAKQGAITTPPKSKAENPGVPGGISRAMNIAEAAQSTE